MKTSADNCLITGMQYTQARRPALKVLFMSGYTELAGVQASRSIGDTELVRKPFRKSELAERIRAVLDK